MNDSASGVSLSVVAEYLDDLLNASEIPDYAGAVNGVQVDHRGPVTRVAVAVDASLISIEGAIDCGANLLIVHHGLFWSGVQPLRGRPYERFRQLLTHDVGVYSSHLPLDTHPVLGNNALLAHALGLEPSGGFGKYKTISVGLQGTTDLLTSALAERAERIARTHGGRLVTIGVSPGKKTARWAICTGAGATSESLREAATDGVDTLIVGEGAHHTGVEAAELGIAVLYVGHYATETFGVQALGAALEARFQLPWSFIAAPTGL